MLIWIFVKTTLTLNKSYMFLASPSSSCLSNQVGLCDLFVSSFAKKSAFILIIWAPFKDIRWVFATITFLNNHIIFSLVLIFAVIVISFFWISSIECWFVTIWNLPNVGISIIHILLIESLWRTGMKFC